ncbi:MAG: deoxyribodipyrimidine photo-lyase [Chloroflexota bacterium]
MTLDRDPAPIIVWFRRDLRLDDHPALTEAVASGRPVIPLVVLDTRLDSSPTMGPRRRDAYQRAVVALDRDLRTIGARLIVRRGDPRAVVAGVAVETGAHEVLATRDVTPYGQLRDREIAVTVPLRLLPGTLVVDPELTGEVRVFTPFHRRWAERLTVLPVPAPTGIQVPPGIVSERLPDAEARGGPEALDHLHRFARERARTYEASRNRLDLDGTSGLSQALHLGTLSARRAVQAVDVEPFTRQLAWRDWAHHLLWFEPAIAGSPPERNRPEIAWRDDAAGIQAWKDGLTGYPTVDAAMRQLHAEGTMHNRARMIVASFLTKDLLVDWRVGAAHFLRELADADVANNLLGWRWSAGVGHDAAPYFRIMNPSLQGERFDPNGAWVRRWVPEVAALPPKFVHRPWDTPGGPPSGYPAPIVEHSMARTRALEAFRGRTRYDDARDR